MWFYNGFARNFTSFLRYGTVLCPRLSRDSVEVNGAQRVDDFISGRPCKGSPRAAWNLAGIMGETWCLRPARI
jgi:hypothetical protein